MKEAGSKKLASAKAELKKAIQAGDPKEIARAVAKVVAADPKTTDVFLCLSRLIPLFTKLLKSRRLRSLDARILRKTIKVELEKVEQNCKVKLSLQHRKIVVDSMIKTLRKIWGRKN